MAVVCAAPMPVSAEWLVTPFLAQKFAGRTNFVDLEEGAGDGRLTFGGSVAILGEGPVGLEADFGYTPRFFERDTRGGLVVRSHVLTLMGNVLVAAPIRLTRESLRPYVVGGVGLMRARIEDVLEVFQVNSDLLGLNVGGGASGPLSPRTSLRFDLRYFKNLSKQDSPATLFGTTRLSFWRGSVGLTLRY